MVTYGVLFLMGCGLFVAGAAIALGLGWAMMLGGAVMAGIFLLALMGEEAGNNRGVRRR